jgi:membrane-associated phospholipid phosphatase
MTKHHHWAAVSVVAALTAAGMWLGYRWHEGWEHTLDWGLLSPAHTIGAHHHLWVKFWSWVSYTLYWMRDLALVATGAALALRRWGTAILLVACGPLSQFASAYAKSWVHRPRPGTMLIWQSQTSFPSGHAFETTAGVLALLTLLVPLLPRWRIPLIVFGLSVIALVGPARVALNVHNPSDVLAGWAMGMLYFGALYLALHRLNRPRVIHPRLTPGLEPSGPRLTKMSVPVEK